MPDANASSANFNACASAIDVERRAGRHRRCHGEQQTYMSEPTWQLYERGIEAMAFQASLLQASRISGRTRLSRERGRGGTSNSTVAERMRTKMDCAVMGKRPYIFQKP